MLRYFVASAIFFGALAVMVLPFCGGNEEAQAYPAYLGAGLGAFAGDGSATPPQDSGSDSPADAPGYACCTGGQGSAAASCSDAGAICLMAYEGLSTDIGSGSYQLQAINDMSTSGPLGPCYMTNNVTGGVPCEGGQCIQIELLAGDAGAACANSWDASPANQTITSALLQSRLPLFAVGAQGWTIEARAAFPTCYGSWPILIYTSNFQCQNPNIISAFQHPDASSCVFGATAWYNEYGEIDMGEYAYAQGGADYAVHHQASCDTNTSGPFFFGYNQALFHRYMVRASGFTYTTDGGSGTAYAAEDSGIIGGGHADFFLDGVLQGSIDSFTGGNLADGATPPGCGLQGIIPPMPEFITIDVAGGLNGWSGPFDAAALPYLESDGGLGNASCGTMLIDWYRVTSP